MDRDVALEVVALVAAPEEQKCLDRAESEAEVRRQCDRDVDVEDPLRDALVGVLGRDDEREDEREANGGGSERSKARKAAE
jgi:hypothetical protein